MFKSQKFLVILLILLFPSVLYLVLTTSKHHFISLPYYGPKDAVVNGDTVYHQVPAFTLTTYNGSVLNQDSLKGKITIVQFFNTACKEACKKTSANLVNLQERIQEKPIFRILSISTQPNDTGTTISAYTDHIHINKKMWSIVSGDSAKVQQLAQQGFLQNVNAGYTETLTLLDKELHIRGFYDGSILKEVNKMHDDMKMLMAEYMLAKKEKKVGFDSAQPPRK